MQTVLTSIFVFGIIIFVHEFGHYALAKLSGIFVEEFSIGMGPKIVSKKWGETSYSLRVLPIGGFCKMAGEAGEEDSNTQTVPRDRRFDGKPALSRMAVIFAGPLMNFVFAAVLFAVLFSFLGIPVDYQNEIGQVQPDSIAEEAGFLEGDRIIKINEKPIETWQDVVGVIHNSPEEELNITVVRNDAPLNIKVIPGLDEETELGMIGIVPGEPILQKVGILTGIKDGIINTMELTVLIIQGLVQLVTGEVSPEGVAGPLGIIQMIGESAEFGLIYLINFTAFLSVNLGLLNLLPIPALDGSRLLFLLLEVVRGKPINPAKENFVHLIGFFLLMLLMVVITYQDVARLFVR